MISILSGLIWLFALCVLVFINLKLNFKTEYYKQKLINRNVDISRVQNMAWWKLWIN